MSSTAIATLADQREETRFLEDLADLSIPELPVSRENATDKVRPVHAEIAALAYSLWEGRERNMAPGSPEEDWYRAEHVLTQVDSVFP